MSTKDDLIAQCKGIVAELEDFYNGNIYKCECCDYIKNPKNNICPNCKAKLFEDNIASLYEYFDDVLDVEYRVTRDKKYKSVSILVCYGGPNIYIDTEDAYVRGYWGNDYVEVPFSYYVRDDIDDIFEMEYRQA